MHNRSDQLPWDQPDWLEQATAWIHAQLAARSVPITGPVEFVHQRPWSAFAQVSTAKGTAYFKAPAPLLTFEAPLTQGLAGWRPDCTAPLLAVDLDRGWMLSADAGITLRSADPSSTQIEHWLKLLPIYAELQIEMAAHMPEMLAFGIPDRRLATFPQLYAQLLEDQGEPAPRRGTGPHTR